MTNKYFYTVIGTKDIKGNQNYFARRVTSSENLAGHDVISVNIFETKREAEKIARFWNYCALQNNNACEETICEPRFNNDNDVVSLRIGYDVGAHFISNEELAERFFDFVNYDKINVDKLPATISDFLYELTRDNGILELITSYRCYEGLEFNFEEYNRTHSDIIYRELRNYLGTYILSLYKIDNDYVTSIKNNKGVA